MGIGGNARTGTNVFIGTSFHMGIFCKRQEQIQTITTRRVWKRDWSACGGKSRKRATSHPSHPKHLPNGKLRGSGGKKKKKQRRRKKAAKSRGGHRQLSGKQLFSFDPTLFKTSDDAVDLTAQLDAQRHKDDVKESDGLDERPDLNTIEEEIEPAAQASEPPEVFDASLFEDDILPDDDILPEEDEPKIIEKKNKKKDKDGGEFSKKKKKKKRKEKDLNKRDPTKFSKPVPFPGYSPSSDSSPEKSKPSVTQNVTIGDAKLFQDAGDLPDI